MKQTIYLYVDEYGVNRMTKNLGQVGRNEIPVKLDLEVAESAFREPVITKKVVVNDWREGVDIADINFKESFITEEEAAKVRQMRLEKMREILKQQGYEVTAPESENQ